MIEFARYLSWKNRKRRKRNDARFFASRVSWRRRRKTASKRRHVFL